MIFDNLPRPRISVIRRESITPIAKFRTKFRLKFVFQNDNDRYTSFARSIKLLNVSVLTNAPAAFRVYINIYVYTVFQAYLLFFRKLEHFIERRALFPSTCTTMINFGSKRPRSNFNSICPSSNFNFECNRNFIFLFSVSRAESERKMLNPETGCYSESVRAW